VLDHAPEGWGDLIEHDADATPGHRPEMWIALSAALAGFEPRVIAIEDGGELIGGMPLMIERRGALAWLHALPYLLSGAPLARPGHRAEVDASAADALAALSQELRAAGGEWSCYRPEGDAIADHALDRLSGETRWMESAVIDLTSGAAAARRGMDRKARQDVSRSRDQGVRFGEEPAALEEAYALHARQSRAWSGHRPLPIELSRRLIDSGIGHLMIARDGRGMLCATLALEGPHDGFVWWSGSHPGARAAEAFPGLLWWIAEWSAARGRRRFDLGASRGIVPIERFKRSLGARAVRYPVRWLDAREAPPLGRLAAALQRRLRRGRPRGEAA
jgi:CelD/BcsL family acetyltransferase involved in cellulose biosynthesis